MWIDNDSTGDPQGFLSPRSGLFPAPLFPVLGEEGSDVGVGVGSSGGVGSSKGDKVLAQRRRAVIGRFRFLGRLAARCLMDGQVGNTWRRGMGKGFGRDNSGGKGGCKYMFLRHVVVLLKDDERRVYESTTKTRDYSSLLTGFESKEEKTTHRPARHDTYMAYRDDHVRL